MSWLTIYSGAQDLNVILVFSLSLPLTFNELPKHLDLFPEILKSLHCFITYYTTLGQVFIKGLKNCKRYSCFHSYPLICYPGGRQQGLSKLQIWPLWSHAFKFLIISHCIPLLKHQPPFLAIHSRTMYSLWISLRRINCDLIFSLLLYRRRNCVFPVYLYIPNA